MKIIMDQIFKNAVRKHPGPLTIKFKVPDIGSVEAVLIEGMVEVKRVLGTDVDAALWELYRYSEKL